MLEINKDYAIGTSPKLWDISRIKTDEIVIFEASKDLPKGTILSSDGNGVFTPVTATLEGTLFILAEDISKGATKAIVIAIGTAYLEGLNAVNNTTFTSAEVLGATWGGAVGVISNKEVAYAN